MDSKRGAEVALVCSQCLIMMSSCGAQNNGMALGKNLVTWGEGLLEIFNDHSNHIKNVWWFFHLEELASKL